MIGPEPILIPLQGMLGSYCFCSTKTKFEVQSEAARIAALGNVLDTQADLFIRDLLYDAVMGPLAGNPPDCDPPTASDKVRGINMS